MNQYRHMRVLPQNDTKRANSVFSTTDLGLAAYLSLVFENPQIEIMEESNGRARFTFSTMHNNPLGSGEVDRAAQEYWNHDAKEDPYAMFQQVKFLKGRIFEMRESNPRYE